MGSHLCFDFVHDCQFRFGEHYQVLHSGVNVLVSVGDYDYAFGFHIPLFKHARFVYVSTIGVAFIISIFDGLKAFCDLMEISYFGWMQAVINFFDKVLPLYSQGVGWLVPVAVVLVLTGVIARVIKTEQPSPEINVQSQQ